MLANGGMMNIGSYPQIYNLGHAAIRELTQVPVIVEEKIDGCVTLDTPILCEDLSYVPAGLLCKGDRIIGFNDRLNDPRFCPATVTQAVPIKKKCLCVTTSEGPIVVSTDHPFLIRQTTNHNGKIWCQANKLKTGMEIVSVGRWMREASWEAGYIAGQFDGEGSLVRSGNGRILSYYQTVGSELKTVEEILRARGFVFKIDVRQRKSNWKRVGALVFRGWGWHQILRFLGTFRPQRLLKKAPSVWIGGALNGVGGAQVVSVDESRARLVMGLSTSSGTYIANGLLSHNSQFSWGVINGELKLRSKGTEMHPDYPEKMFALAAATAIALKDAAHPGWVYRGEYLKKPKHNALAYDRVPERHLMVFDVQTGLESYLSPEAKWEECARLGLECVPMLFRGTVTLDRLRELLESVSVLGGQKIEGVVLKPAEYNLFGRDRKVLMGKFVSEAYKEVHASEWKQANPGKQDLIEHLIAKYASQARWNKAIQHLRERGEIEDSPRDIGKLMAEVPTDVEKEEAEAIRNELFKWAWPRIRRGIVRGLPEYYKQLLLEKQFEGGE